MGTFLKRLALFTRSEILGKPSPYTRVHSWNKRLSPKACSSQRVLDRNLGPLHPCCVFSEPGLQLSMTSEEEWSFQHFLVFGERNVLFDCRCHLVYKKDLVAHSCQYCTYPGFLLCRKNTCQRSLFVKWKRFGTAEASIINIVTSCNLQNVLSPLNNKPLTPELSLRIRWFEKVDIMDSDNKWKGSRG